VRPTLRGDIPGGSVWFDPVIYGNEMYLFGPTQTLLPSNLADGINPSNTPPGGIFALNLDTMTWREVQTIGTGPSTRLVYAAALLNGQMLIIGGISGGNDTRAEHVRLRDVWSLDLKSLQWKNVITNEIDRQTADRSPAGALYAARAKGDIYVLSPEQQSIWRLNIAAGSWTHISAAQGEVLLRLIGNNDDLFAATKAGSFLHWDWTSCAWAKIGEFNFYDGMGLFAPQQSSFMLCLDKDTLKYIDTESIHKSWQPVFDSLYVPACISKECFGWQALLAYRGVFVMVGWDKSLGRNSVWLLSILSRSWCHSTSLSTDLVQLLNSPYTDFKLVPKEGMDHTVPVFKGILAVRWKWFASLLQSGMQETSSGIAHIPKSRDVVFALVKYLYSGTLSTFLPVRTLVGLVKLADMYELPKLEELASMALLSMLSEENCIKIFRCGIKIHDIGLRWFGADYILEHFVRVSRTPEYAKFVLDQEMNEAFALHVPADLHLSWSSTYAGLDNRRKRKADDLYDVSGNMTPGESRESNMKSR